MAEETIPSNVVVMTQESACPDCQTMNVVPRFDHHKAGTIKCGACGSIYWNTERIACSCDASRFMILGGLSDSGHLLIGCLGCGHLADGANIQDFLESQEAECLEE